MKCDHHDGNGCTLGLFGGNPSPGVCEFCDEYVGPPRGAGDLIEAVTKRTGIKAIVDKVTGNGCGCSRRRDKLNKFMPFRGEQDDVQSDHDSAE